MSVNILLTEFKVWATKSILHHEQSCKIFLQDKHEFMLL